MKEYTLYKIEKEKIHFTEARKERIHSTYDGKVRITLQKLEKERTHFTKAETGKNTLYRSQKSKDIHYKN